MVIRVEETENFTQVLGKIKDNLYKMKIKKQILKIIENPKIGKPMRYGRRGTREVYVKPFRLSYLYVEDEGKIIFSDLYHKKKQ